MNLPRHLGQLPNLPSLRTVCSCLSRDAKCGKIQCQGGASRPVIGTNAVSIETNIPLQEGGRILCRGTHVYLGDDMPDPGLVLAGTKCAVGKVRPQRSLLEAGSQRSVLFGNELQSWFSKSTSQNFASGIQFLAPRSKKSVNPRSRSDHGDGDLGKSSVFSQPFSVNKSFLPWAL